MILKVITPQQETLELTVSLPKDYLGKEVHCLFYIKEEAKTNTEIPSIRKKPSDFFGILDNKESEKFQNHIDQIRGEWSRDI